ncbi:MAG TPA: methyltransferase domain-containing protein [Acidimicrobiales bacterium]|nr:methyltransferase domain-containing protein [Acidimicrobiales bacterium]
MRPTEGAARGAGPIHRAAAVLAEVLAGLGVEEDGPPAPEAVKACCARAYGVDLVGLFLGESYHPGGLALTRRLGEVLGLRPGERVLDVASGIGTTALLLAAEYGVEVVGVDLGEAQVARARSRAEAAGVGDRVRFEVGDAEGLAAEDASFDAVVCECAFCTFPAKETAASELARVTRPGGRVGIADVWLEPGHLDPALAGLAGWVACVADARPVSDYRRLLADAGLEVSVCEGHDDALAETIDRVEARIRALRMLRLPVLSSLNFDRGTDLARRAARMVADGQGGYMVLVATRPVVP